MSERPGFVVATFLRRLQWGLLALAVGWLLWLLAPVLTPFAVAALLGWMGDPLVDRLERRLPRNTSVILVFAAMTIVALLAALALVPLLQRQVITLVVSLPHYRDWFTGTAVPWLEHKTGLQLLQWLDPQRMIDAFRQHWEAAGGAAATLLGYLSRSGFVLLGWIANLVLLPVLTFFFLRDWDLIVERIASLVPRRHAEIVGQLAD